MKKRTVYAVAAYNDASGDCYWNNSTEEFVKPDGDFTVTLSEEKANEMARSFGPAYAAQLPDGEIWDDMWIAEFDINVDDGNE